MTKQRIPAEEAVFLAIGVPSKLREAYAKKALSVLDQYGFGVTEMEPDDIVAQAAHVVTVRKAAEAASQDDNQNDQ